MLLEIVFHLKYSNVFIYSDYTKIFGEVISLDSVCTLGSDSSLISPRPPAFILKRPSKPFYTEMNQPGQNNLKLETNSSSVTKGGSAKPISVTISLHIWSITSPEHIFFLGLDLDFAF